MRQRDSVLIPLFNTWRRDEDTRLILRPYTHHSNNYIDCVLNHMEACFVSEKTSQHFAGRFFGFRFNLYSRSMRQRRRLSFAACSERHVYLISASIRLRLCVLIGLDPGVMFNYVCENTGIELTQSTSESQAYMRLTILEPK